ncbi:MAG: peptidylprolyl isomerase [Thermoplasmata archaeon]
MKFEFKERWKGLSRKKKLVFFALIVVILVIIVATMSEERQAIDPNKDRDYGDEYKATIEWDETLQFVDSIRGVSIVVQQVSNTHEFEVKSSTKELLVTVSWSGGLDLDIYLYDAEGNDVGGTNGATTSNPEEIGVPNIKNPGIWRLEVVAFASLMGSSYDVDISTSHRARNAILVTEKGNISLKLWEMRAPNTTANFVKLAESGFYDNITFHRVVPDFVIQTGDPTGTGEGGSDETIDLEVHPELKHIKGAVGMARELDDVNSATSQFYITMDEYPHLNGNFSVFGQVFSGMNVVWQIEQGDILESVKILEDEELD